MSDTFKAKVAQPQFGTFGLMSLSFLILSADEDLESWGTFHSFLFLFFLAQEIHTRRLNIIMP